MDDGSCPGGGGGVAAAGGRPSPQVMAAVGAEARRARPGARGPRYCEAHAQRLLARVALGESVAQVCQDPDMPTRAAVTYWKQTRPTFAEALEAARRASGRWAAPHSRYCQEAFEAVWLRVCEGEGVVAVCEGDPQLPHVRTFYRWVKARPELQAALRLAREIQGDRLAEESLADARAVTPPTARAAEVKLKHLRWMAARLAPVKYGPGRGLAPVEDEVRPPPPKPPMLVTQRDFWLESRADGWRRVRASYYEPETGRIVDEPPGDWEPPPPGGEAWLAQWGAFREARQAAADAEAARRRGPGLGSGSQEDGLAGS